MKRDSYLPVGSQNLKAVAKVFFYNSPSDRMSIRVIRIMLICVIDDAPIHLVLGYNFVERIENKIAVVGEASIRSDGG